MSGNNQKDLPMIVHYYKDNFSEPLEAQVLRRWKLPNQKGGVTYIRELKILSTGQIVTDKLILGI